MSGYYNDGPSIGPKKVLKWTIGVFVTLFALFAIIAVFSSLATVRQSEVGFQIGGGPLDPSRWKVKSDLMEPGRHITGLSDGLWTFPAYKTLRFQDFDVDVTTYDGKKVKVTGQIAFRFVGEKDPGKARAFAEGHGSRKYGGERPGESDEGWTNFLDAMFDPEVRAALKEGFGQVYCADFEPSCRAIDPRRDIPAATPENVYTKLSTSLQERTTEKLGDDYLRDIRVRVKNITLPEEVQRNIDQVTAEQAKTQAARQAQKTAFAEAKAIRVKGRALRANRDLIALEVAKECKGGEKCTIIVGNAQPSVPTR